MFLTFHSFIQGMSIHLYHYIFIFLTLAVFSFYTFVNNHFVRGRAEPPSLG